MCLVFFLHRPFHSSENPLLCIGTRMKKLIMQNGLFWHNKLMIIVPTIKTSCKILQNCPISDLHNIWQNMLIFIILTWKSRLQKSDFCYTKVRKHKTAF